MFGLLAGNTADVTPPVSSSNDRSCELLKQVYEVAVTMFQVNRVLVFTFVFFVAQFRASLANTTIRATVHHLLNICPLVIEKLRVLHLDDQLVSLSLVVRPYGFQDVLCRQT